MIGMPVGVTLWVECSQIDPLTNQLVLSGFANT